MAQEKPGERKIKEFVSGHDLDFAISHISGFYDTDFFPRAEEFKAIAYSWPEIRSYILESTFKAILGTTPTALPWPKIRGGYRMVHRLEPFDALIYTAFAKSIAQSVENQRASPDVACSYRMRDLRNSFFTNGSGYDRFRAQCEFLATKYEHVLCADITDFYNKIYLHRLQNAIQSITDNPPGISKQIEYFLSVLNTKASQGIPVGPAASIVMSEASLNDVDDFLHTKGVTHVRYVDDFRIFGSKDQLVTLLQDLTVYLNENHRLSLNADKTFLISAEDFVTTELNNHYQEEKLQIFGDIEGVNPYAMPGEDDEDYDEDNEQEEFEDWDVVDEDSGDNEEEPSAEEVLAESLTKLLSYPTLDLGLARAIVRSAKSRRIESIIPILLNNVEFFAPAINDIILYLDAITGPALEQEINNELASLCDAPCMKIRAVSLWMTWYFSRHPILMNNVKIRTFVMSGDYKRYQAAASITMKNASWAKENKTKLIGFGSIDRRSTIISSQTLSKDERENWLKPILRAGTLNKLEAWTAEWVIAGAPSVRPELLEIEDEGEDEDGLPY